jgi:hypothetical protein
LEDGKKARREVSRWGLSFVFFEDLEFECPVDGQDFA